MTQKFPYIILADDDPDDRDLFCTAMLRRFPQIGFQVLRDGDELLDFLNQCSSSSLPACIVLDYKMPKVSAPQVLQATGTGTRYAQIPKVVWSTSQRKKDMEECLRLGATHFLIKPATGRELDSLIKSFEEWFIKAGLVSANETSWSKN